MKYLNRIILISAILALISIAIFIELWIQKNKEDTEYFQVIKSQQICSIKNKDFIEKKKVALTFDDGPSSQYTEKLLDVLKEENVRATFFLIGKSIKENEKIVIRMSKEGHLIGNHTYNHSQLTKIGFDAAVDEINTTNAIITNITGQMPLYIRPPFGSFSDKLFDETNMSVVMWNIDPEDWKYQNKDIVASRVIKNVNDGDIILMHDIFESSVEAAKSVICDLKKQGYDFVTIDELDRNKKVMRKYKKR